MKNMAGMMKQAADMQKKMKVLQKEIEEKEVTGSAGNGLVEVTMTCKHQVRGIKLDDSVVDADDKETLEDLIAAALNDANNQIETYVTTEMNKITGPLGGMGLPGM